MGYVRQRAAPASALRCDKLSRSARMNELELYAFLTNQRLGVLGTISDSGAPQSALVGIAVTRQFEIVFDTIESSRKYPNLISRPACSFVVGGWGAREQTVQYEGQAELLQPPELQHFQEIYFKLWPDGSARMGWPGIVYFVVRPTWIRYSDFDQNPPLIQEFTFALKLPRQAASTHS